MDDLINALLAASGYAANPYFTALRDGTFARADFVETQAQFYFAVDFFSRPMAALAAKIPTAALRVEIVRNVWEEHGEGDAARVHGHTFRTFLQRLGGITPDSLERRALWPEVRAFNTVLAGACVLDDYLVGAGALGMIERMFSDISCWLGRGVVARGWLAPGEMIHYDLHEKADIKHSADFFEVLQPEWGTTPDRRYLIEQGLRLGAYIFGRLYEDLYRARERRLPEIAAGAAG